jgi:hypothetical protein
MSALMGGIRRPAGQALAASFLTVALAAAPQQAEAPKLKIVIVEGEGAINNIKQRVAGAAIVRVEDENDRPVAGALVTFLLPNNGPGAAFADGSHTLTVTTNEQGLAVARSIRPNSLEGQFQIQVTASHMGATARAAIVQTNAPAAAAAAGAGGGISGKLIAILAVAAGAAAGGVLAATSGGGGNGGGPGPGPPATPVTPARISFSGPAQIGAP